MIEKLRKNKIVIFGTGHVANKFYRTLKAQDLQQQIVCFTRTKDVYAAEAIDGIPVYGFDDICIDGDTLVCLAVHEAIRAEIEETVKRRTSQYLWIYPYLYRFMFGEPEQKEVALNIRELLNGLNNDFRLGVRLAAIEQQEGLNTYGFDYYVRAQMTYCNEDTARQRLAQFSKLITGWNQTGYDRSYLIAVNRNYEVIDGNHRVAMAVYQKQPEIYGDIYPTDLPLETIHGCEPLLSKEILQKNGFVESEIKKLEKIQERYLAEYEKT